MPAGQRDNERAVDEKRRSRIEKKEKKKRNRDKIFRGKLGFRQFREQLNAPAAAAPSS
jgi:hypothetical protein